LRLTGGDERGGQILQRRLVARIEFQGFTIFRYGAHGLRRLAEVICKTEVGANVWVVRLHLKGLLIILARVCKACRIGRLADVEVDISKRNGQVTVFRVGVVSAFEHSRHSGKKLRVLRLVGVTVEHHSEVTLQSDILGPRICLDYRFPYLVRRGRAGRAPSRITRDVSARLRLGVGAWARRDRARYIHRPTVHLIGKDETDDEACE
jgi:hypothetical protein